MAPFYSIVGCPFLQCNDRHNDGTDIDKNNTFQNRCADLFANEDLRVRADHTGQQDLKVNQYSRNNKSLFCKRLRLRPFQIYTGPKATK